MRRRPQLVIFLRAPQRGAVKRRLARDIGPGAAHEFYLRTSRTVIARLTGHAGWRVILAVTPDRLARSGRFWSPALPRLPQGPGGLDRRMARVLRRLPPGPVVIVGSDVPGLTAAHIDEAFARLAVHEAVFGPAADGGYWLIGLARRRLAAAALAPRLFKGVRWSSASALKDTRANLPPGAEGAPLELLEDVDDAAAWRRHRASA